MTPILSSIHPIVQHQLAALRDVQTAPPEFRRLVRSLTTLLAHEALSDLATTSREVTTPMGQCHGWVLADTIMVVPILRAGLGMADGILDLIPEAEVWHLGLVRDETTLQPTAYYSRLPESARASLALVVDPMLATGGSAVRACELLRSAGVQRIKMIALLAAPEGIERLSQAMPDVPIHVGAIDARLNHRGFIDPGLGDAGDRQFGTCPG